MNQNNFEENYKEMERKRNIKRVHAALSKGLSANTIELPPNYETKYLALLEKYSKLADKYADLAVKAYNGDNK